ncbi:MAG: NAD(P)/FAD-dependent oxidoreductase [Propionibacteriaceae bacterium]
MSAQTNGGLIVVGGGPAGLGAARAYREAGAGGAVLLVSADPDAPYHRPPLTKDYLRGESGPDELPLVEPSWYIEHDVKLRLNTTVTGVDLAAQRVSFGDQTAAGYDRLILATGSDPRQLPVPGGDLPGLIHVRDRESADAMRAVSGPGRRVAVLGSGFVGCEAAASLAMTGTDVVLVTDEDAPHASRLGTDAGGRIHTWLTEVGVELRTGDAVAQIARDERWTLTLEGGDNLVVDAVVVGGGARPNVDLARTAGLRLGAQGIEVDAGMLTSDPHVWAAGDIAHADNPAAGRALRVEHWGEAEAMGEVAGANAAGGTRAWAQAPGFWSTIGTHTLKYAAWGDGYDRAELRNRPGAEGWAVWYLTDETVVGVVTSDWDDAYERGQQLVEAHAPASQIPASRIGPS